MTSMPRAAQRPGYQILLATLLSINFGIVFFDRNALNFLMPFVQPELRLNNTQVGILAGALSFTWAAAAFLIGMVSDALGPARDCSSWQRWRSLPARSRPAWQPHF